MFVLRKTEVIKQTENIFFRTLARGWITRAVFYSLVEMEIHGTRESSELSHRGLVAAAGKEEEYKKLFSFGVGIRLFIHPVQK